MEPHGSRRACIVERKGELMSLEEKAKQVIEGLGGADNIKSMEPCITRIRVELSDISRLDEKALRAAGAHGVMKMGGAVQVVMGTQSDNIEAHMRRLMEG
jgi:PTS system N-acetylglucosamine-specific IIB component